MENTKKEMIMVREFAAPREMVFKAWTDQELVKQWWGPQGVFIPVCELDVKPGGKIHIVMEAGEELGSFKGTQWPMTGEYVEIDEPKKIVYTSNAIQGDKVLLEFTTTITFEELNDKTKMNIHIVLTKVNPGSEFAIAGMEQGWSQQLDKLVEFVNHQA
ncbi:SRPBCC family protein [soil metagenome]